MSRRRYISTSISLDRKVNMLAMEAGDFAALLYTWMIAHAEDDCTVPSDPGEILVLVMPWRRDKDESDVQAALEAMLRLGLLERCQDPARLRFPPASFYRYQAYIGESRRSPAPALAAPAPAPDAARPPAAAGVAPEPLQFGADERILARIGADQRDAPEVAQNPASVSISVSSSVSVRGERAADADAPPDSETVKKTQAIQPSQRKARTRDPDIGPLVDAFRAAGLPDPFLERGESKAAQILLRHIPPGDIVECWQDYASGAYGDDWERRNLSFSMLASNQRLLNWRRWRDNGRTELTNARSSYSQRSHI